MEAPPWAWSTARCAQSSRGSGLLDRAADHLLLAFVKFGVGQQEARQRQGLPAETWALLENVTQTRNEYYAMSWRNSWRIATASRRSTSRAVPVRG